MLIGYIGIFSLGIAILTVAMAGYAYLFLYKRPKIKVYFWALIVCVGMHLVYKICWEFWESNTLNELLIPLIFLYPVILYQVVFESYTGKELSTLSKSILISPFVIQTFMFISQLWNLSNGNNWQAYDSWFYASATLYISIYITLTYQTIKKHSTLDLLLDTTVRQLIYLSIGLIIFFATMFLNLTYFKHTEINEETKFVIFGMFLLAVLIMGKYLLNSQQSEIAPIPLTYGKKVVKSNVPQQAYSLSYQQLESYSRILDQEFVAPKRYLSSTICLSSLSSITSIPQHHLSQLFNRYHHKTFYVYLAELRIKYALKRMDMIQDDQKVDTLSAECGFNSTTSFNKYFKQYTGMTPNQYRLSKAME